MKQEYVCGFLFNPERRSVVLIQKNRPEWQKGRLNGVGGHIDNDIEHTYPAVAMSREFEEETDVKIIPNDWFPLIELTDKRNWKVYFFTAFADKKQWNSIKQTTDEIIVKVRLDFLARSNTIYNLQWLIPLALDNDIPKPLILKEI